MKTLLSIFASIIFFSAQLFSQEETLLGSGEISNGGFGGPVVKYVQINGKPGVLVGGRGGWIINHSFVIGGGGYGLANDIKANGSDLQDLLIVTNFNTFINFGYGGLELEYIIQSDKLLHFSIYTLLGAGAVSYRFEYFNNTIYNRDQEIQESPKDAFFIFEPAVNAEVNVVSFMRINAGISYRFIAGADLGDLRNSDLAGPSAALTLKFGKF